MSTGGISDLVARYLRDRHEYLRTSYNETDARVEFIDAFFEALGWDVSNKAGVPPGYRDVIREVSKPTAGAQRPDYAFRRSGQRQFFVEAKRPGIDITTSADAALQARRYGWSGGLRVSILTNFEHLAIYDTTIEPREGQNAQHARRLLVSVTDYPARFHEIAAIFSRDAVYSGDFDEQVAALANSRPAESINAIFLEQLNRWRLRIGQAITAARPSITPSLLNELVQRVLLRILFLRMCEDRGIESYEALRQVAATADWSSLVETFIRADARFDTDLFETRGDPLCIPLAAGIPVDGNVMQAILDDLYYPAAPYDFSVFEPEFLGSVYEFFLRDQLVVRGGTCWLERKPENTGRDIIATPRPVIERLIRETLAALRNMDVEELATKTVLDPACGSGGFLLAAFDALLDAAASAFRRARRLDVIFEDANGWRLTFEAKRELLERAIFGVDRDPAAVDVARFSLLLKLLEGEATDTLPTPLRWPILPRLDSNIVYGDTLVDGRIDEEGGSAGMIGAPLTWGTDIRRPFSFIVGNPPYLKTEDMVGLEPVELAFYKRHYKTAYQQFDKYFLFLERCVGELLEPDGMLGMIVSRKFINIEAARELRAFLTQRGWVARLVDFGDAQLFGGRITYTCLLFIRGSAPEQGGGAAEDEEMVPYELVASARTWLASDVAPSGEFATRPAPMQLPRRLVSGKDAWVLPATPRELDLLRALLADDLRLGQIMDVFNGIQTSANEVFVISKWQDSDDGTITFQRQGRAWTIEREATRFFFEDRQDGRATLRSFHPVPPVARVIFPYRVEQRLTRRGTPFWQAVSLTPQEMQDRFPLAYAWLVHNRERLLDRSIRPPYPSSEWYRYGRQQALAVFEERPKIVVGVNSIGDKYAYDTSNILIASGGTAGECAIAPFHTPPADVIDYDLRFVLALLNHKAIEFFCRKRGSPFRGGYYARGTAVLKDVPLPRLNPAGGDDRARLYHSIIRRCQILIDAGSRLAQAEDLSQAERTRIERSMRNTKEQMDMEISVLLDIADIIGDVELPSPEAAQ